MPGWFGGSCASRIAIFHLSIVLECIESTCLFGYSSNSIQWCLLLPACLWPFESPSSFPFCTSFWLDVNCRRNPLLIQFRRILVPGGLVFVITSTVLWRNQVVMKTLCRNISSSLFIERLWNSLFLWLCCTLVSSSCYAVIWFLTSMSLCSSVLVWFLPIYWIHVIFLWWEFHSLVLLLFVTSSKLLWCVSPLQMVYGLFPFMFDRVVVLK